MPWDKVIPILQTGLAGLGFLLAFLSYRIITLEQKKDEPSTAILNASKTYFVLCLVLAFGVGTFQIAQSLLQKSNPEQLAECLDSFSLLKSRQERAETEEDLHNAINSHVEKCGLLIDQLG